MIICIATSNYFPDNGGIATFSRRLAILLANAGHKPIVLSIDTNSNGNDSVEVDKNGAIIVKLKNSFHNYYRYYKKYFKQGSIDAPYWIAIGLSMRDWVAENHAKFKIDIIEASAFGGIGSFLKDPSFPPVVLSGHGTFFQYKRFNFNKTDEQTKLIEKLERLAFNKADAIISHSPQSKKDIERFTNAPVYIARIAFFPEYNLLISGFKTTNAVNKYALVVGSLQQLKGPLILFDAIEKLNLSTDELIIRWAGSDNYFHETGEWMSVVLKNRYPDIWNNKIIWEKNPGDAKLAALYQHASFIIIPTIWESYNVISVEAAFFKKPIIVTNSTGSSFLFKNEENALIIKANDSKRLADAIFQLHKSSELCTKLGEAAYKTISEHLEVNNIVEERVSIYNYAIQNRTSEDLTFDLSLFKKYTTTSRKTYFRCRAYLKRLFKK